MAKAADTWHMIAVEADRELNVLRDPGAECKYTKELRTKVKVEEEMLLTKGESYYWLCRIQHTKYNSEKEMLFGEYSSSSPMWSAADKGDIQQKDDLRNIRKRVTRRILTEAVRFCAKGEDWSLVRED
ncbi:hypothetical protein AAC387_Pa03g3545 [Persea americana]